MTSRDVVLAIWAGGLTLAAAGVGVVYLRLRRIERRLLELAQWSLVSLGTRTPAAPFGLADPADTEPFETPF